jgi:hypothetical protein
LRSFDLRARSIIALSNGTILLDCLDMVDLVCINPKGEIVRRIPVPRECSGRLLLCTQGENLLAVHERALYVTCGSAKGDGSAHREDLLAICPLYATSGSAKGDWRQICAHLSPPGVPSGWTFVKRLPWLSTGALLALTMMHKTFVPRDVWYWLCLTWALVQLWRWKPE